MNNDVVQREIVIIGGGLAGLTLALQLKRSQPERDILVLERRSHPVAEAAHKVGESTVEVGAHYFSEVLGLKAHFSDSQLPKFGLRFFFRDAPAQDISERLEVGGSEFFPIKTYQIDRGIFENFLAEEIKRLGVEFSDSTVVRNLCIHPHDEPHSLEYENGGERRTIAAHWIIDASGRFGMLKRKLDLSESVGHDINAAWFRLSKGIDIETWSDKPGWLRFGEKSNRWLSTNHLMGNGYWVWLIPLASGSISVGIVADPKLHSPAEFFDFESALSWLQKNEPRCAKAVTEQRDTLQDFLRLKNYSHSCKKVFSADRWAITGEAGLFLDPFYSPGSDFIAYSNTYITELVRRDFANDEIAMFAPLCEKMYFSFFRNSLKMFENQYPIFGNGVVMPIKIVWDYTLYWSVLAFLFFNNRLFDFAVISKIQHHLARAEELNQHMQQLFNDWNRLETGPPQQDYLDHLSITYLLELNRQLLDELTENEFLDRFEKNMNILETVAMEIVSRACLRHATLSNTLDTAHSSSETLLSKMFDVLDL